MDLGSSQTSWSYKVRFWVRTSLTFAARERLVLGRIELAEKSNELVAIPSCSICWPLRARSWAPMPSVVNATSEATQCASTPASNASAEPYPFVRQVESLFFALWCSNWSVVQFDSRMHCSVTCHFPG